MRQKVIIITSLILSLLFMSTALLYSATALSARHKKHRHHVTHIKHSKQAKSKHIRLPVVAQAESDNTLNVNPRVWNLALKAYNNAIHKGVIKQKIITIIDYSLPSSVKRMWVVDVNNRKVLFHTLVAHGKRTGGLFATHFSDKPGSRASSIGTFVTETTYMGSKGYSLRLRGLEPGFNEKAKSRAIVMHGAWYATQDFAKNHGRLGLSWGCPAVSPSLAKPIINTVKGGSMVFAYYPEPQWLQKSHFLGRDNSVG